ncbi:MAG: hypothetical protein JW820_15705 [Spirochaetales bacterium]|nr:hypothetical protein [Spirochaetales bacterium]
MKKTARRLRPALALCALVLAGAALLSCPSPIDEALLTIVEDEIAPNISITEPVDYSYYKTCITVVGVLEDSAKEAGDHLGSPGTLEIRVSNASTLDRTVTFAADGSYSVSPPDGTFSYDPATGFFGLEISAVALTGSRLITFVLTDRNANQSELTLSLHDDPTGPYIDLVSPENYSTYGLIVDVSGTVTNAEGDTSTSDVAELSLRLSGTGVYIERTLNLEPGSIHDNGDGTFTHDTDTSFTFNSADGSFADQFLTVGGKGTLTLVVTSADYGLDDSQLAVQLIDGGVAPEVQGLVYPQLYSSSLPTPSISVSGTVTEPSDLAYFTYTVKEGSATVVAADITGVDPATGAFGFAFGVAANALAGTLAVTILAEDSGGRDSQSSFTIYDDPTPPAIVAATLAADNSYIDVSFDDGVYATGGGSGALTAGDLAVTLQDNGSGVTLDPHTVTRTDGSPLQGGEQTVRVHLSYSSTPSGVETVEVRPAASSIYDQVGNPALTTATTGAKLLHDQQAARVLYVGSPTADGSYRAGSTIDVTVHFSEAVYVSGFPTLLLETGTTDREAVYQTGHGTSTLSFLCTVQTGDTAADLDYAATNALALPTGAAIDDNAGNSADLTLPAPGAPESLAGTKAIVVDTTAPAAPTVAIADGGDEYLSIGENAAGVEVTITGEPGASYLITPTNAIVTGGNSGTLAAGAATPTFAAVTDGLVSLSVVLTDTAGNTGSAGADTATADLTPPNPPSVAITDGADGYIDPTENAAGVNVSITGAAGCSYAITPTNATVSGGNAGVLAAGSDTRSFAADGNGSVTLAVTLTDPAGNTSASNEDGSFAYITPPAAPTVTILDGDGWISIAENGSGVDFTIAGLAGCSYTIVPTNASISGALTGTLTTGSATRELSALLPGAVSISVELEDPVGGTSPAGVDSSSADLSAPNPPSVVIADGGDGWINQLENSGVGFTITGEAGASYLVSLTNGTLSGSFTGTLTGGVANRSFTANGNGTVTVSVTLADAAGNTSSSGSDSSTADLSRPTAPTVSIDDGTDGEIASGESVDLTISGEADTDYDLDLTNCSVTGGTGTLPGGGSVTLTLSALGNGAIVVEAALTDEAGNVSDPGSDASTGTGF